MKVEFRKFFASAVKIAGIGYVVVPGMIVFAILFLYFDRCGLLFRLEFSSAATAVRIISAAVAVVSAVMWFIAGFRSRLIESVMKDQLVTTGIYAWVRNPLYVAVALMCTSVLVFITCNLAALLLLALYWLWVTVLVSSTEEKILAAKFREVYAQYCSRVNRCIPRFPRR
jgi:protein-S-isoprenylcysteine O-methyltransferase Ste14